MIWLIIRLELIGILDSLSRIDLQVLKSDINYCLTIAAGLNNPLPTRWFHLRHCFYAKPIRQRARATH